jgi:hypothetical protein
LNKIIIIIYNKKNMSVFNQTTQSFGSNNTTLNDVMMSGDLCIGGDLNVGSDINTGGNLIVNGDATIRGNLIGIIGGDFNGDAPTTLTSTQLVVGTRYQYDAGGNITATLPPQANSERGDKIEVIYTINSGVVTHKYGTSGEFFSASSSLVKPTAGVDLITTFADGINDDFLNLIGGTNKGPGSGTKLTFVFTGNQWQVDAVLTKDGDGLTATTAEFATT